MTKLLLPPEPRHVAKFRKCRLSDVNNLVIDEKNIFKTSSKYNGLRLALAKARPGDHNNGSKIVIIRRNRTDSYFSFLHSLIF